jgi:hypothetical protein
MYAELILSFIEHLLDAISKQSFINSGFMPAQFTGLINENV